jgi:hypothetical protein
MAIYRIEKNSITELKSTTFKAEDVKERRDLQRLLREHVEFIAPDTMVISEEFGEFEGSKRRIDLLAIDKSANLVVIELKRTEEGDHMELQSIRYAAMVSKMTFERTIEVFSDYLDKNGNSKDARVEILNFLGWKEPDEAKFAQDVYIVLASADFSKELTSSVLWLNEHELNITCVRLKPYNLEGHIFVDVEQIIPLPEAIDCQTQVKEKSRKEQQARVTTNDLTKFIVKFEAEQLGPIPKNRAIFFLCKHLCEKGVSPDDLSKEFFEPRSTKVWYDVDADVTVSKFFILAQDKFFKEHNKDFDKTRWFCADDELIHHNGKTYAFSTQWGGEEWRSAMNSLKEKYSKFDIDFWSQDNQSSFIIQA